MAQTVERLMKEAADAEEKCDELQKKLVETDEKLADHEEQQHPCEECRTLCNMEDVECDHCQNCVYIGFERWSAENNYEDGHTGQDGSNTRAEDDYYDYLDERDELQKEFAAAGAA